MKVSASLLPATRVVGGTFGTHHTGVYFCGLHPNQRAPMFTSVLGKVEHLERTHHAFVWERPSADGGGYSYTATVPV